jgi:hypothetical protein
MGLECERKGMHMGFVRKLKGKRQLEKPRLRWADIKEGLLEIALGREDLFGLG